jgi:hypothetical protein
MIQLLLHLCGDYITQTNWMALNKTKNSWAALLHATVYALPFLLVASWKAWIVIYVTHFFIDRFRLARYVCWAKNQIGQKFTKLSECDPNGYPDGTPIWLSTWLLIITDNTMHLAINAASIHWLK